MPTSVTVVGISGYNVAPAESTQSLQAYIELTFMSTANNYLVNQLSSLDSALGTTTSVINTLSGLQNLKNLITIKTGSTWKMTTGIVAIPTTKMTTVPKAKEPGQNTHMPTIKYTHVNVSDASPTVWEEAYVAAACAFFNRVTQFSVSFTNAIPETAAVNQFVSFASQLSSDITSLSVTTPMLTSTLANGTVTYSLDPNSLLAKAKAVLSDIRANIPQGAGFATGVKGLENWITDSYNKPSSTSSGAYQQDLTYAITAAQSLNNTQTSSVEEYLYIFQEFYQSAAALITGINQIITQMANNIKQ